MSDPVIRASRESDGPFGERVSPLLHPGPTAVPRDPDRFAAFFARFGRGEAGDAGAETFVAVDADDAPTGMIVLHQDKDSYTGPPRADVTILVVDDGAEGRGVGQALMRFTERWGAAGEVRCLSSRE